MRVSFVVPICSSPSRFYRMSMRDIAFQLSVLNRFLRVYDVNDCGDKSAANFDL